MKKLLAKSVFVSVVAVSVSPLVVQAAGLSDFKTTNYQIGSSDGIVQLQEPREDAGLSKQETYVTGFCYSPDNKKLAVSYRNRPPSMIQAGTGKVLVVLGFSPEEEKSRRLLASENIDTVSGPERFAYRRAFSRYSLLRRTVDVLSVDISPDGSLVAGSGPDVIKFFNSDTGRQERVLSVLENSALSNARDFSITRFGADFSSLSVNPGVFGSSWIGSARSSQYSPDGKRLVICQPYGVSVRELEGGKEIYEYHQEDFLGGVYHARYSPNGKYLAVLCQGSGKKGSVRALTVLDALDGKVLFTESKSLPCADLEWTKDSQLLGFLTTDGHLKVLKSGDWSTFATIAGGDHFAFNKDGSQAVLTSKDAVASIYSLPGGQLVKTYLDSVEDKSAVVKSIKGRPVAWSGDGSQIAVGGEEFMVLFWAVK